MRTFVLLVICALTGMVSAAEYTVSSLPNPRTANARAFVSNPDGILQPETEQKLNAMLDSLEAKTGAEVVVVGVESIGQADYFSFATDLWELWKIGKAKKDNGLLLFFVFDQRKIQIETGYGLEGVLPDAVCSRIRTQIMNPQFRKGNYDEGVLEAVSKICSIILKEPVEKAQPKIIAWNEILPIAFGAYLLLLILAIIWMNNAIAKIRKNTRYKSNIERYKALKSQKNGILVTLAAFLPVLAGVAIMLFSNPIFLLLIVPVPFTTIPANIYGLIVMKKERRKPIDCNVCGAKMHILSEKEEDKHLKLAQQFEEQLHAVDYDVFLCESCKNEAIFTLDKPSVYSECPRCKTKAFILKEKRLMVAPTYFSGGTERITHHCKFCGYEEHHNNNLPRLTRNGGAIAGGAAAGSIFSGSGGFGGGGFSGGGSFGGGMTGGGGSGGSW